MQLHVLHATSDRDFDAVFKAVAQLRAAALVIASGDPLFGSRAEQLVALALRHAVPAIQQFRAFAAAGGLVSYGGSFTDRTVRSASTLAAFLKARSLPTFRSCSRQNSSSIINLKTAKTLGLEVPPTLLARADEVIE